MLIFQFAMLNYQRINHKKMTSEWWVPMGCWRSKSILISERWTAREMKDFWSDVTMKNSVAVWVSQLNMDFHGQKNCGTWFLSPTDLSGMWLKFPWLLRSVGIRNPWVLEAQIGMVLLSQFSSSTTLYQSNPAKTQIPQENILGMNILWLPRFPGFQMLSLLKTWSFTDAEFGLYHELFSWIPRWYHGWW